MSPDNSIKEYDRARHAETQLTYNERQLAFRMQQLDRKRTSTGRVIEANAKELERMLRILKGLREARSKERAIVARIDEVRYQAGLQKLLDEYEIPYD